MPFSNDAWFGLKDDLIEDSWFWTNGLELDTWNNWDDNQPNSRYHGEYQVGYCLLDMNLLENMLKFERLTFYMFCKAYTGFVRFYTFTFFCI